MDVQKMAQDHQLLKYTKIIEACKGLLKNTYWNDLKTYLIEDMLSEIENRLQYEKDFNVLLRYQGEWGIAKKFIDLQKVIDLYEKEIQRIKTNAKT